MRGKAGAAGAASVRRAVSTSLSLQSGRLSLTVLPQHGGRVQKWTFAGRELLSGPEANPDNWGATYWTSPQADWGWPPVAEVDSAAYTASEDSAELCLIGPPARIGERRFRIEKRFSVCPNEGIDTEYRIVNLADSPLAMASWEISRVPPGGLTFFPTGASMLTPIAPHAELLLDLQDGVSFYDHAAFEPGLSRKVHADGREGFLAHVQPGQGQEDLLFLKLFADSLPERQAPGEGEVELFANFDGRYVEVEVQGTYDTIAPGQTSSLFVRTVVVPVPAGLRADRHALAKWTREVVTRVR